MTGFLFSGGGGAAGGIEGIFSVKTYGAVGNGSTDDRASIQAAIDAAQAAGVNSDAAVKGAVVWFPPGRYIVGAALHDNNSPHPVQIIGSGKYCTIIEGTLASDYILKKDNLLGQSFTRIENITIKNNSQAGGGGVLLRFLHGFLMQQAIIQGFISLHVADTQFNSTFINVELAGFGSYLIGHTGCITGQNTFVACTALGYDVGFQWGSRYLGTDTGGAGGISMTGCRTEGNNTGILIGQRPSGATTSCQGTITAFSTERCSTGVYVKSGSALCMDGITLTGDVGPFRPLTSASWSGGTATYISAVSISAMPDTASWANGTTRTITVNGMSNALYDVANATATKVNNTTFTIVISNPGGTATGGNWSAECQYGLRIENCQNSKFSAVTVGGNTEVGDVYMAALDGGGLTFQSVLVGSWVLPPNYGKAGISYIQTNAPSLALPYASLPTSGSSWMTFWLGLTGGTPEGTEYDITDGQKAGTGTALFGDIVVGGGAQHIKVRYNGTNWTRCG